MTETAPTEPLQEPSVEKPKPERNWRGYLKEYAIIVVGVLTALGAQQAVETLHDRQRAAQARDSIRSEIVRNLSYMNARKRVEACIGKKLDEVDGLIAASAAGKLPPDPIWIGLPLGLLMLDGKYKAAVQSGSVSLLPTTEQGFYSGLYSEFETYWQQATLEYAAWSDLRVLEKHPPPSPILDWQLRSAMQKARSARWGLSVLRDIAMRDGAAIGIKPGRREWIDPTACLPLHTARAEALKTVRDGAVDEQP